MAFLVCVLLAALPEASAPVADLQVARQSDLLFTTWTESTGNHPVIRAQCVDLSEEKMLWSPSGLILSERAAPASRPIVVKGEPGYGIFFWMEEKTSGESRLMFQIVDYLGNVSFWPPRQLTSWLPHMLAQAQK